MASQEQYPDPETNSSASTDEQLRHSGKDGYEKPIREFRDTPLDQAPLDYDPRLAKGELHTRDLPEGFHPAPPAPEKPKTGRRNLLIGGGVLAVVATVGTVLGLSGGENDTNDRRPDTISQPVEVDDIDDTPGESPQAIVGQPGSTIENISVKPSQEIINEALEPVTVLEYPTATDALDRFSDIENVYYLSATIDTEGSSEFPETQESIDLRRQLQANIYSEEEVEVRSTRKDTLGKIIAMELWFINESGALSPSETATWHQEWIVNSLQEVGNASYTADVTVRIETNIGELDEAAAQNYLDIAPVIEYQTVARLHNDGERWIIDSKSLVD